MAETFRVCPLRGGVLTASRARIIQDLCHGGIADFLRDFVGKNEGVYVKFTYEDKLRHEA